MFNFGIKAIGRFYRTARNARGKKVTMGVIAIEAEGGWMRVRFIEPGVWELVKFAPLWIEVANAHEWIEVAGKLVTQIAA